MNYAIQPSLFSEFDDEIITGIKQYCIKNKNNSDISITISVEEGQEAEMVALEKLGYFLLSDSNV